MPFDVGELLREIGDIAFVWLPIMMFALIIYLLWRTLSADAAGQDDARSSRPREAR